MPGRLLGFVSGRGSVSSTDSSGRSLEDATPRGSVSTTASSLKIAAQKRKSSMDHIRIRGLSRHSADKKAANNPPPKPEAAKPAKLDIVVESPPLVSYNSPANSTGALFSALLKIDVSAQEVTIESLEMHLVQTVTLKRPVQSNCPECTIQSDELKSWAFVKEQRKMPRGEYRFPFSYLFPGHLPATSIAHLAKLTYTLSAVAKTSTGERITFIRPINLARSILPGPEKHSLRVFPPTNLTASVTMVPVMHPIGDLPVHLRLSGITTRQQDGYVRWRARRITWRIEEQEKTLSPACSKHQARLVADSRGFKHEHNRILGDEEIHYYKTPWKTDFDTGEVELEFKAVLKPNVKPVCDVEGPDGFSVSHALIIEMVMAEEYFSAKKARHATPTGAARILRMSFKVHMTERGGMGISWDEETPPVYENVPASPPKYPVIEDFDLAEIEGQIDDFQLGESLTGAPRPGSSSAVASASDAVQPPGGRHSPRLAALIQSTSHASGPETGGRITFTADDLLSEPAMRRRQSEDETDATLDEEQGTVS